MIWLPRYLLILTTAVLVLLPPWWCCALPRLHSTEPAKEDTCCRGCGPAHSEQPESPTPSRPTCCCLPQDRVADPPRFLLDAPAFTEALPPDVLSPLITIAAHEPAFDGPLLPKRPLHLLRCVWLC